MSQTVDTLILGAGPAGLAVGACLRQAGVPFAILERSDAVGSSWRRHYERLHLHTARRWSSLPGMDFPPDAPQWVPRADFVAYLDRYAAQFGLEPRFGETVTRAARDGDAWDVTTDRDRYRAPRLVVATGYNRVPRLPEWPGQGDFAGELLHSSRYKNGSAWRGKRVLVVGFGNSGGEIAIDLWEHGARPLLCVRGPVHVVPRESFGLPNQATVLALRWLPLPWIDRISRGIVRRTFGDLRPYGLQPPERGPLTLIRERGRVPLIDVGTIGLIKQGAIRVVPAIRRFEVGGIECDDGARHDLDAVVLATGYRAGLEDFLVGAEAHVDERGNPRRHGVEDGSGLWFIGYSNPPTGALREIAIEARRIASEIARQAR